MPLKLIDKYQFFLIVLFYIGCSPDSPPNPNPGGNTFTYTNDCPISNFCPLDKDYKQTTNWVWINSGLNPLDMDNTLLTTSYRSIRYQFNDHSSISYTAEEDPNDCSIIQLKDRNGHNIRKINLIANDSLITIIDSLICPKGGCKGVNKKYIGNYLKYYQSKISCDLRPQTTICNCVSNKTGNNCSSTFSYLDLFDYEYTLCNYSAINGNTLLLTKDYLISGDKMALVCLDKMRQIIWQYDLSKYYLPGNKRYYNQSQIIENRKGNILVYAYSYDKGGAGTFLYLTKLNQQGQLIDIRSYLIPNVSYVEEYLKIHALANGNILVECKPKGYYYLMFNNDGDLLFTKDKLEQVNSTSESNTNSYVQDNHFIIWYGTFGSNSVAVLEYDDQLNFIKKAELKFSLFGNTIKILPVGRLFKSKDKIIFLTIPYDGSQEPYGNLWFVFDENLNQISSGLYNVLYDFDKILAEILPNGDLRLISDNNGVILSDFNLSNGTLINSFKFKTSTSTDYVPVRLIGTYFSDNNKYTIIGDGNYFGTNILFYTYDPNSNYPNVECK